MASRLDAGGCRRRLTPRLGSSGLASGLVLRLVWLVTGPLRVIGGEGGGLGHAKSVNREKGDEERRMVWGALKVQ